MAEYPESCCNAILCSDANKTTWKLLAFQWKYLYFGWKCAKDTTIKLNWLRKNVWPRKTRKKHTSHDDSRVKGAMLAVLRTLQHGELVKHNAHWWFSDKSMFSISSKSIGCLPWLELTISCDPDSFWCDCWRLSALLPTKLALLEL